MVDLRSIGSVDLDGVRDDTDFRWSAYVATDRQLGLAGAIRIAPEAWVQGPGQPWATAAPESVDPLSVDLQVLATALAPANRTTAEDRGVDVIEGARARHCVVAVDGTTFREAFPQIRWLVGDADIHRWRGELDYWVFMDGQLGQVVGDAERRRHRDRGRRDPGHRERQADGDRTRRHRRHLSSVTHGP